MLKYVVGVATIASGLGFAGTATMMGAPQALYDAELAELRGWGDSCGWVNVEQVPVCTGMSTLCGTPPFCIGMQLTCREECWPPTTSFAPTGQDFQISALWRLTNCGNLNAPGAPGLGLTYTVRECTRLIPNCACGAGAFISINPCNSISANIPYICGATPQ